MATARNFDATSSSKICISFLRSSQIFSVCLTHKQFAVIRQSFVCARRHIVIWLPSVGNVFTCSRG